MKETKRLIKSFRDAGKGVKYVFLHERNFRIQLLMTVLVLVLTFVFELKQFEIIVILMLVVLVLILEFLNSALEKFVDILKPRLHYQVAVVKDIMAAMVLLASLGALVVGTIIFWPHVYELFL